MFKKIGYILQNVLDSFNAKEDGWSARKLSAFAGIIIAAHATFKYCDATVLDSVITTWLIFVAVCLGLVTVQQIAQFKSKKDDAEPQQDNK